MIDGQLVIKERSYTVSNRSQLFVIFTQKTAGANGALLPWQTMFSFRVSPVMVDVSRKSSLARI